MKLLVLQIANEAASYTMHHLKWGIHQQIYLKGEAKDARGYCSLSSMKEGEIIRSNILYRVSNLSEGSRLLK